LRQNRLAGRKAAWRLRWGVSATRPRESGKHMKLIGYWMRSLRDTEFFLPQEFVAESPPDLRRLIAAYLDRGSLFNVYRGVSWCRFYCGFSAMGNRELSDGYFAWPEGLSHYVREHAVCLPEEFIQHVQSGTPPIPKKRWPESLDDTYWNEWCRTHSARRFRSQIQASLREADDRAEAIIGEVVAKMEANTGLADVGCCWVGCNNRALAGRVLCARCAIKGSEETYVGGVYHDIRPVLTAKVRSDSDL
jgi:hypothetical protein